MTDSVRTQFAESVATITLDRPQARNALTVEMKEGLLAALNDAADAADARAVVITGAGGAFCAGQDLREHAELLERSPDPLATVREHYNPIISAIMTMPKPVIAAIRGSAAGAGASIAFACDFRVAARGATFLLAFSRIGLGADSGASWTLPRLVGAARAAELLLLAEPLDAESALAAGLLTSLVDDAELQETAASLARRLAAGPTAAYAAIKEALVHSCSHGLRESLENEARLQSELGRTADHRQATSAFLRKERPSFQGR